MRLRVDTRAWGVAVSALALACDGRGAEAAGQFADGFAAIGRILLVIAALTAAVYLLIWWQLVATLRRGGRPRVTAAILVVAHAAALLAAGSEGDATGVHRLLWWTAVVPAAAFAVAYGVRPLARAGVFAAVMVGLWTLPVAPPRLTTVSAPIIDGAATFMRACGLLADGRVVCTDDAEVYPWAVAGLDDATAIDVADDLACALRRHGPPVCWGGTEVLSTPGQPRSPWQLADGEGATGLVVSSSQVLLVVGEALRAWPHSLPGGLTTVRAAVHDGDRLAVLDVHGELWVWNQVGGEVEELVQFPGFVGATEVALHGAEDACVLLADGAVDCLHWEAGRAPVRTRVEGVRAVQIVAIDDAYDSFCGRGGDGRVTCWSRREAPELLSRMPTASALRATHAALCDRAAVLRCTPLTDGFESRLEVLLDLPVAR